MCTGSRSQWLEPRVGPRRAKEQPSGELGTGGVWRLGRTDLSRLLGAGWEEDGGGSEHGKASAHVGPETGVVRTMMDA